MKTTIENIRKYCDDQKAKDIKRVEAHWENYFQFNKENLERTERIVEIIRTDKDISNYILSEILGKSNMKELRLYCNKAEERKQVDIATGEREDGRKVDSVHFLDKYSPELYFKDLEFITLVEGLPLTESCGSENKCKYVEIFFSFNNWFMMLRIEKRKDESCSEDKYSRTVYYRFEEIFEVKVKRLDYYVL